MEHKKVSIVDENDTVIGSESLFVALEKGLIRQVARVFVFDTDGRLLLQKRSNNVRHPNLLDQSVGGHVDEGETYRQAAIREMQEEIGLTGVDLLEVVTSYRTNVFNGVYKTIIPAGTAIEFDEYEIESIHWLTVDEVDQHTKEKPEDFTPDFVGVWNDLRAKLIA